MTTTLLSNVPCFSQSSSPLGNLLLTLIENSYSEVLPGIEKAYSKIAEKLIAIIFNELPHNFKFFSSEGTTKLWFLRPASFYEAFRTIRNSLGSIIAHKSFRTKVLSRMFASKKSSFSNFIGSIDFSLLTHEITEAFKLPTIGIGAEPIYTIFRFLEEKVELYDPKLFNHPSSQLIISLKKYFYGILSSFSFSLPSPLPPSDYILKRNVNNYNNAISMMNLQNLILSKHTVDVYKEIFPEFSLPRRLIKFPEFFDLLDKIFFFQPLNKQQWKENKNQPQLQQYTQFKFDISSQSNVSIFEALNYQAKLPKPKPKPRKVTIKNIVHILPALPPKSPPTKKIGIEKWMHPFFNSILQQISKVNIQAFIELIKTDGQMLTNVIQTIHQCAKFCTLDTTDFLGHLLNLLLSDVLIKDSKATVENPHPQASETLFRNKLGQIFDANLPSLHPSKRHSSQKKQTGLPHLEGTKRLLAYICYIMTLPNIQKALNPSIFSDHLVTFFKHHPDDLKKRLGNDNTYGFQDYLANLVVSLVNFTKDIEARVLNPLIHILACEQFADSALGVINRQIKNAPTFQIKQTIIQTLLSIATKPKIMFTNSFKIRLVAWASNPLFVGCPLPQFSLDFIHSLSMSPKLHIDIKKAVTSAIVAYWKHQAVSEISPVQFDELFEVIVSLFNSAKNQLAPTLCQLLKPNLCRSLVQSNPLYKEILQKKTNPESLIGFQSYGNISFPKKGVWKEKFEKFISAFLGTNLLTNDQQVLQLTVQVLTKIGVRGGDISDQISTFITKTLNEFNILVPSPLLMNFTYSFCFPAAHQKYTQMIDGFVNIFAKARIKLDEANALQIKQIWLNDAEYDKKLFQSLGDVFQIFKTCFDEQIIKFENADDLQAINSICQRILSALEQQSLPTVNFEPFLSLRNYVKIFSNKDLTDALSLPPGENAMEHLLKFLNVFHFSDDFQIPQIVYDVFMKNSNSMTEKLLNTLTYWSDETAMNKVSQGFLRSPIKNALQKIEKNCALLNDLLPKLWKFSTHESFQSSDDIMCDCASHLERAECYKSVLSLEKKEKKKEMTASRDALLFSKQTNKKKSFVKKDAMPMECKSDEFFCSDFGCDDLKDEETFAEEDVIYSAECSASGSCSFESKSPVKKELSRKRRASCSEHSDIQENSNDEDEEKVDTWGLDFSDDDL